MIRQEIVFFLMKIFRCFDKDGNIEKGREVFYYDKGLYFMAVNQLDSAECYFRKALKIRMMEIVRKAGIGVFIYCIRR